MEKVLITGGAGDVLAISCYLTEEEKSSVKTVYYATRSRKLVDTFIKFIFPNLEETIIVQDVFATNAEFTNPHLKKFFAVIEKKDLIEVFKTTNSSFLMHYDNIVDLSLLPVVRQVINTARYYSFPHKLLTTEFAKVPHDFSSPYILVQPNSENLHEIERDFSYVDFITLKSFAEARGLDVVIVNESSNDKIPITGKNIHNYVNKLSFLQSLELCKTASYYIGTGSSISVFASKCIPSNNLVIKATRRVINEGSFYYAPYSSRDVCFSSIDEGLKFKRLI